MLPNLPSSHQKVEISQQKNNFPPTEHPIQRAVHAQVRILFCSHFPLLGRRDPPSSGTPPYGNDRSTNQQSAHHALCTKEVSRFFPTTTSTSMFKRKKCLSRFSLHSPEPRSPPPVYSTPSLAVAITMDEYIRAWMQLLHPRLGFPPRSCSSSWKRTFRLNYFRLAMHSLVRMRMRKGWKGHSQG